MTIKEFYSLKKGDVFYFVAFVSFFEGKYKIGKLVVENTNNRKVECRDYSSLIYNEDKDFITNFTALTRKEALNLLKKGLSPLLDKINEDLESE